MEQDKARVRSFFDSIAAGYDDRYAAEHNRFLHHFFAQRLSAATDGVDFRGKSVVDIGAGTGQLYALIAGRTPEPDYLGIDISPGMLEQSPIPPERRVVGSLVDAGRRIPDRSVDLFFMLGVTTYMTHDEIAGCLRTMAQKAVPGAVAVVTFSNRGCVEYHLQRLAGALLRIAAAARLFRTDRRVAGQSFARNCMTLGEFGGLLPPGCRITQAIALNQTFTPLNRIAPGPSIAMERLIRRLTAAGSGIRRALSSDVLVKIAFPG
jgi:SAM-dependent methyltransferase